MNKETRVRKWVTQGTEEWVHVHLGNEIRILFYFKSFWNLNNKAKIKFKI